MVVIVGTTIVVPSATLNVDQGRLEVAPGGSLEVAVADITRPDTLKPDLFQAVRAVICCTAVNVSPKEGDTPNRDKYKQVRRFLVTQHTSFTLQHQPICCLFLSAGSM